MYSDYSYYTAITYISPYFLPAHLVLFALMRSNIIEFCLFRFLLEKGVFHFKLRVYSVHLLLLTHFHVYYTTKLAYYLLEKQYREEISKILAIFVKLQWILSRAKYIFILYLLFIYFMSFF